MVDVFGFFLKCNGSKVSCSCRIALNSHVQIKVYVKVVHLIFPYLQNTLHKQNYTVNQTQFGFGDTLFRVQQQE